MGLSKVTYEDGITVIHAGNLNAIQDAIIDNEGAIEDLDDDKADVVHTHAITDISDFPTPEVWTFTTEEGTTFTRNVYAYAPTAGE